MREWPVRVGRVAMVVFGMAAVGRTCGPSFPEAVFVRQQTPGAAYPKFVAGELGVIQGAYPIRHLAIAYDILNGRALTSGEKAEAVALQQRMLNRFAEEEKPGTGLTAWLALRERIALPGGYTPADAGTGAKATIDVERKVPGVDFQSFTNCLDDAFRVAAMTLETREREHGAGSAEVLEWVRGQDAVFSNSAGPRPVYPWSPKPAAAPVDEVPDRTPRDLGVGAPVWLQKDRAYQVAAARFYRTDFDGAIAGFRAVAADGASPWAKTARYLVARAMIRRAAVGQMKDVPPTKPGTERVYADTEKVQDALKQAMPGRMAEARAVLEGIRVDPAMEAWHASAISLIDLIDARVDPAKQAGVLAERISAAKEPAGSSYGQNLMDLTMVLNAIPERDKPGPAQAGDGLRGWLTVMQAGKQTDESGSEITVTHSPEMEARALGTWRRTKSLPWLVAAMSFAEPGGPGVGKMLASAKGVPESSPGWLTVTYHRLRLEGGPQAEVEGVLQRLDAGSDRSAVNLFQALLSVSSPTMVEFLRDGARIPAATSTDGIEEDLDTTAGEQVCGPKLRDMERALFAEDTATVLNQRMPVRLLAEAALSPALPPHLRFAVAQSAWTRAVLLDKPEVARAMAPVLIGCRESWRPVLEAHAAAGTAEERHVAGLLALMRFASTEPMVRAGEPRAEGFATYSQFRDNWWCGNAPYEGMDEKTADPKLRDRLFAQRLVPEGEVADPQFLTAADRGEAAEEVAALQKVPGAADYFAREALGWYEEHPADKVDLELLGEAERVMRNSCRSSASKELNRRMFVVVQGKYPGSAWARKYTTWE